MSDPVQLRPDNHRRVQSPPSGVNDASRPSKARDSSKIFSSSSIAGSFLNRTHLKKPVSHQDYSRAFQERFSIDIPEDPILLDGPVAGKSKPLGAGNFRHLKGSIQAQFESRFDKKLSDLEASITQSCNQAIAAQELAQSKNVSPKHASASLTKSLHKLGLAEKSARRSLGACHTYTTEHDASAHSASVQKYRAAGRKIDGLRESVNVQRRKIEAELGKIHPSDEAIDGLATPSGESTRLEP